MFTEINHFGIVVRDLQKSIAFYRDLLGAEVVFDRATPPPRSFVIYLQIAGGLIELLGREEPADDEVYGVTHLGIITDDLDTDWARVVDAGYPGLVAPRAAGSGVGRMSFVGDPAGVQVELIQRKDLRIDPIEHPVVTGFDHYALAVPDEGAALAFYTGQLGLQPVTTAGEPGTERRAVYLGYDERDTLALVPGPTADGSKFAHLAFRVRNVDAALAAFAARGVAAEPGVSGLDATGRGRIGAIRDPDGVLILLLEGPGLRERAAA